MKTSKQWCNEIAEKVALWVILLRDVSYNENEKYKYTVVQWMRFWADYLSVYTVPVSCCGCNANSTLRCYKLYEINCGIRNKQAAPRSTFIAMASFCDLNLSVKANTTNKTHHYIEIFARPKKTSPPQVEKCCSRRNRSKSQFNLAG